MPNQNSAKERPDNKSTDNSEQHIVAPKKRQILITILEVAFGLGFWELSGVFSAHNFIRLSDLCAYVSLCSVVAYVGIMAYETMRRPVAISCICAAICVVLGIIFLALCGINLTPHLFASPWRIVMPAGFMAVILISWLVVLKRRKHPAKSSVTQEPSSEAIQAAARFEALRGALLQLQANGGTNADRNSQLNQIQEQAIALYFSSVRDGVLPTTTPAIVRSSSGQLHDWRRLAERIDSPSVPHPNKVALSRDGSQYIDHPNGVARWIDHAALLVTFLRDQSICPTSAAWSNPLGGISSLRSEFNRWAETVSYVEMLQEHAPTDLRLQLKIDHFEWRKQAEPFISIAASYGIDTAPLSAVCHEPHDQISPSRRAEVRAILEKLEGEIVKSRRTA